MIASTIIPPELASRFATVSEALLTLPEETIRQLRLHAPLVCDPNARVIVPFEFVVRSSANPVLAIREHMLHDVMRMSSADRAALIHKLSPPSEESGSYLDWLFPPPGDVGFWDAQERLYRTRYMRDSAFSTPLASREQVDVWRLHDIPSYWEAVRAGRVIPFGDQSLHGIPPNPHQPWAWELSGVIPEHGGLFRTRLAVGYRGCNCVFDYPFRPSVFRRFSSDDDARPYNRLKSFVGSLLTELCGAPGS